MTAVASILVASVVATPVARQADQSPLPSGQELVARHVQAIGGRAEYKAIRSMRGVGRMEIVGAGIGGDLEVLTARPNRSLMRITVPGIGRIEAGFDGKVGWSIDPLAGPEVLTGRRLDELREDGWFDSTLYESDFVKSVRPVEHTTFGGRAAVKAQIVLVSGRELTHFFAVDTGLHIGVESERAVAQGVVPMTGIFDDYRQFGSLRLPTALVQRALGVDQRVTFATYEFNSVPDSAFALPASIAALAGR
jgi:hypothetical protein